MVLCLQHLDRARPGASGLELAGWTQPGSRVHGLNSLSGVSGVPTSKVVSGPGARVTQMAGQELAWLSLHRASPGAVRGFLKAGQPRGWSGAQHGAGFPWRGRPSGDKGAPPVSHGRDLSLPFCSVSHCNDGAHRRLEGRDWRPTGHGGNVRENVSSSVCHRSSCRATMQFTGLCRAHGRNQFRERRSRKERGRSRDCAPVRTPGKQLRGLKGITRHRGQNISKQQRRRVPPNPPVDSRMAFPEN